MLSEQTIHLINSFGSGVEDQHAQDVLLHAIFSRLVVADHVSQSPELFLQACMTLARLYWDQRWDPARVFLYILTGYLIAEDQPLVLSQTSFPFLGLGCDYKLNPETINGVCDLHAEIFNALWFNYDEDEDDESGSEDEESGEDSQEDGSDNDNEDDDENDD